MNSDNRQAELNSRIVFLFKNISEISSILIALLGCVTLIGWIFNIPILKSGIAGLIPIKTNTSICFILIGLFLWLSQTKRPGNVFYRGIAKSAAIVISLIGLLTMLEYIFGFNFGIDQLLFREPPNAIYTTYPNRMAFNSAINFLIIGSVFLLYNRKKLSVLLIQAAAVVIGALSLVSFISYIYDTPPIFFMNAGYVTSIALPAVMAFLITSIGMLFIHPDLAIMNTISANATGGMIIRRISFIVFIIPLFLGWLALYLEKLQIFNQQFGEVFLTSANIFTIILYTYILGIFLNKADVLEKKADREARQLALIVEHSDEAIISKTLDGTVLTWNRAAEEMYGYSAADAKGHNISFIVPSEKTDELLHVLEKIKHGGAVEHLETRRCKKNGSCIDVSLTISPIKNEAGDVVGFSTISHDITERKNAQEKLQASEVRYRRLFESAKDGILILDADSGKIVDVNPFFKELMGYSREELLGKELWQLGIFKDIADSKSAFLELQSKEYVRYEDLPLQHKDGHKLDVEFVSNVYRVNHMKVIQCNIRDIAERKKAERALQEALKAKSAFTNMVSHELRTPLSALKESVSQVAEGLLGSINKEQKEFLEMAKRNVDRLARLITEVLDFQTLETGKMVFRMQDNDINEVIKETKETMDIIAKEKGLDFILNLGKDLPKIRFDRDKIAQVLSNLVNNSLKLTEKGNISISTTQRDNVIQISIKDTGPGIKEQDMPRLFQEYEQLERKTGGTGLGLAISLEIIKAHGGSIWAESTFGQGATMYFVLPVQERRRRA